ncbi:MAG: aminotransferase class III-fold pyridoxal phosphate-dependent enzyme [Polyangiales bacterium]
MSDVLVPYVSSPFSLRGAAHRLTARLQLSLAKHRSLAGHARMSQRVARLVPFYEYDDATFFCSDGAPPMIEARRRAAFERLAALYDARFAKSAAATAEAAERLSDLQFTAAYRVPFPYRRMVQARLRGGAFVEASDGATLTDLDGNQLLDLSGAYGVNVHGHAFYKECLARGAERAAALGPVLGPYHPSVADNVRRLTALSGLDEVSFHMSGTEAVMQAVRLARYHTRRTHIVRFCGAYHGWWGDVQPGVGNPTRVRETYTLTELSEQSLRVLAHRRDVACVLVNPLQMLHPNRGAAGDSSLLVARATAAVDRATYADWLRRLREVCSARGIVLILDEVFSGFRLAPGGAQEYFGVQADLVTYGKTLGGGLPIGVVCGRRALMKRFRDDRPTDICFARGTFNAHPYVMASMQAFLERMDDADIRARYVGLDAVWDARAARLNLALREAEVPVAVENLSSVFSVCYPRASRYHWMLQYYLRAEGLQLPWTGTARLIFSLDFDDATFDEVTRRFVAAARAMQDDGWWWADDALDARAIRRRIIRDFVRRVR